MKLDELKKLADAIANADHTSNDFRAFTDACTASTIKQLIALIEMQHEALKAISMKQARWTDAQINALDAYDKFNGGE